MQEFNTKSNNSEHNQKEAHGFLYKKSCYSHIFIIVTINILFFIFLFFLVEIFSYKSIFCDNESFFPDYKKFAKLEKEYIVGNHLYTNYKKPKKTDLFYYNNDGREYIGEKNYKNPSILLLGDSYNYGLGLKKSETFGYQLSKYIKSPVYNWAFCTEGLDYSVLLLKNKENIDKLKKETTKNPLKYVILTYSYQQPVRADIPQRQYRYFYLRKYNLLNGQKFSKFDYLYSFLAMKNKLFIRNLHKGSYEKNLLEIMKNYLKEINKDIKKNFPDAKLVLLLYSDDLNTIRQVDKYCSDYTDFFLDTNTWKTLEEDGIIVLSTKDLLGRKMTEKDILQNDNTITIHPNAEAWTEIIPPLITRLDIKK